MKKPLLAMAAASLLLARCQESFTRAEIVGTYQAKVDYGIGLLILHSNGTYDQNFTYNSKRVVKNKGRYTYNAPNSLDLKNALAINQNLGKPQYGLYRSDWSLTVESVFGGKNIVFDPDMGWAYDKIK